MRIDFTLSIGYTRRRPSGVTVDRWEARMDSLGLIVVGAVATVVILVITVPRIIEALTHP
jgi:hypothetical protein